ncbi:MULTISPECIES: hypothetical protein [unclassified Bradyrhizobium]|uniref:hypothetical protein n=1 Tax=unclassified Bradyrhizobium TaxID=2631580 RepID=UPI002916EAEC|nr:MULTISPECIES: hypothetical protein [unclassified Bradyrhizobium]
MRRWLIIWSLYAGMMGFALGASFFFGIYGRNVTESGIAANHEQYSAEEGAKSKKEETDEALAYYTLWLMAFTGVLAFATVGLGIATVLLYDTGEKQFRFAIRTSVKQSRDMKASIAAADRSAAAAERALTDLERPWIFVHLSPHLVDRKAPPEFKIPPVAVFQIGNHGRMPAIIRTCYIALEGLPQTEPSAGLLRDEFHMSIGPQERSEKLPIDCPGGLAEYGVVVDLISEQLHPVPELKQTENFFFYIVIEYVDVRGKVYKSSFCWRFDLGVNYWVEFGGPRFNYLT